jgi:hypothetical protein
MNAVPQYREVPVHFSAKRERNVLKVASYGVERKPIPFPAGLREKLTPWTQR